MIGMSAVSVVCGVLLCRGSRSILGPNSRLIGNWTLRHLCTQDSSCVRVCWRDRVVRKVVMSSSGRSSRTSLPNLCPHMSKKTPWLVRWEELTGFTESRTMTTDIVFAGCDTCTRRTALILSWYTRCRPDASSPIATAKQSALVLSIARSNHGLPESGVENGCVSIKVRGWLAGSRGEVGNRVPPAARLWRTIVDVVGNRPAREKPSLNPVVIP